MKSTRFVLMGAATLVLVAGALRAAEHTLRPGEYEMTTEMKMEGMNHQMPPTTMRHCFTAEDVKDSRRIAQGGQPKNSDCEIKDMKMSGSHATWSMTCKSGAKGSAEMDYRGDGYDMKMDMEMPGGEHGAMKMKMHTTAKRVGDCGK
jgi:hypothetical protein